MRRKIILCGASYGLAYVSAIQQEPASLELVGLLASGRSSSRMLARALKVPYYTRVNEITKPVHLAVVAIGGPVGDEISLEFLRQKIPVLREHPVTPSFLQQAQLLARAKGTVVHVNHHFYDVEASNLFKREYRRLLKTDNVQSIVANFNGRTLCSGLDCLIRIFGRSQKSIRGPRLKFFTHANITTALGQLNGKTIRINVNWCVARADDGQDLMAGHQVDVKFRKAVLAIGSLVGPVLKSWNWANRTNSPSWQILGVKRGPNRKEISGIRLRANCIAIRRIVQHQDTGVIPDGQQPEHLRRVAKLWCSFLEHRPL
ncbi:MAG: hypothetical protein E7813_20465 [Bradyrhizobium sp.]|uniref:Gfo/Idh/MocA family oxidoreductase n=1 Tax=Bradyrhizobium sp. TaxID=376 RepID=UPI0012136A34|nr:Gfo/Idh/MocA family oxidoreductase [Bradyrhizobium sp.]THD62543.1 MAG: hypothetical protein E7813_20465 [Bradyrhizobium sp.]